MTNAATIKGHSLSKKVPCDSSSAYGAGWEYGDWYITQGGTLVAETPDCWDEEKANGFSDRLALERKAA